MKYFLILFTIISFAGYSQKAFTYNDFHTDTAFIKFKSSLQEVLIKKDTTLLKGLLADEIYGGYDEGPYNPNEFIKVFLKEREGLIGESKLSIWDYWLNITQMGFWKSDSIAGCPNFRAIDSLNSSHQFDFHTEFICLNPNQSVYKFPSKNSSVIWENDMNVYPRLCSIVLDEKISEEEGEWINPQLKIISDTLKSNYCKLLYEVENEVNTELCAWSIIRDNDGYLWTTLVSLDKKQIGFVPLFLTTKYLWEGFQFKKINGNWKIIAFGGPSGC